VIPKTLQRIRFLRFQDAIPVLDGFFLFLFFLSFSFPAMLDFGGLHIPFAETTAILFLLWRASIAAPRQKPTNPAIRVLLAAVWSMFLWTAILWVFTANWLHQSGFVIGWFLSVLVFTELLRKPAYQPSWKTIATLILLAALPDALIGASQILLGIGYHHKDLLGWGWKASTAPIQGLLGYPNNFAVSLYWPLLLSVGLALEGYKGKRVLYGLSALLFGLDLFWTFSRSTMLAAVCALFGLMILLLLRRKLHFAAANAALAAAGGAGFVWIAQNYALQKIFSGRLLLWTRTLNIIAQDPSLMAFGYLNIPSTKKNLWWIPHNIYLSAWIQSGFVGVAFLIGIILFIFVVAWRHYGEFRKAPLLAACTMAMAGMFLVFGNTSLYLNENYILLTFISVLALWAGLFSDLPSPSSPPEGSSA
jgi:hypothetical protein